VLTFNAECARGQIGFSGAARRAKPDDAMILTRFVHVEALPVEPMLPRMAPGRGEVFVHSRRGCLVGFIVSS